MNIHVMYGKLYLSNILLITASLDTWTCKNDKVAIIHVAIPDIIMFTYYHCTSIDYNVLCE